MISKRVFWGLFVCLVGIACAIAYVARERGNELARIQRETQSALGKADADGKRITQDAVLAKTQVAAAEARAKKAEDELAATRKHLSEWQTVGARAGVVTWLGGHANCVGRASDGRCNAYRLPDGVVLETDAPEQSRQAAR